MNMKSFSWILIHFLLLCSLCLSSRSCLKFSRVKKTEYLYAISPFGDPSKNFHESTSTCKKLHDDAQLAIIRDQDTDILIGNLVSSTQVAATYFIGLNRSSASNGIFIWRDGVPSAQRYSNWISGSAPNILNKDCAIINSTTKKWDAGFPSNAHPVVCEITSKGIFEREFTL